MGLWERFRAIFGGQAAGQEKPKAPRTPPPDPDALWLHFRCSRCGSMVRVRAHKRNDLNRIEEENDLPGAFVLHKDVMDNKCFQLMHADIYFDASYQVVAAEVQGGELVSQEEYEAAQRSVATPGDA